MFQVGRKGVKPESFANQKHYAKETIIFERQKHNKEKKLKFGILLEKCYLCKQNVNEWIQ